MSADVMTGPGLLDHSFLAAPTAVGEVRMLLGLRLASCGLAARESDVFLIAAELVTNAVEATPDGRVRVQFWREAAGLVLRVWDGSDEQPTARPVAALTLADIAPDAEALDAGHDDGAGGWGLPIVEALSLRCGVKPTAPHGKWVWSLIGC
ncbi:ATP-binding protein [Spirillospora sp. NPDC000708]